MLGLRPPAQGTPIAAPYGVYSIPEVAMVGLTEEAAAAESIDYAVGRAPFASNTRAAISGAVEGMVKLVFERTTLRLLGVHVLGDARDRARPPRPSGDRLRRHHRVLHQLDVQRPDDGRGLQARRLRRAEPSEPLTSAPL